MHMRRAYVRDFTYFHSVCVSEKGIGVLVRVLLFHLFALVREIDIRRVLLALLLLYSSLIICRNNYLVDESLLCIKCHL